MRAGGGLLIGILGLAVLCGVPTGCRKDRAAGDGPPVPEAMSDVAGPIDGSAVLPPADVTIRPDATTAPPLAADVPPADEVLPDSTVPSSADAAGGTDGAEAPEGGPRMVRGEGYEGVILDSQDAEGDDPGGQTWLPTAADVAKAEQLVREQLPGLTASPEYQQGVVRDITDHLSEYRRQYVGRPVEGGRRVLWINFFRSAGFPEWTTGVVFVRGGGHDYFNLTVDLDDRRCGELQINSPR